ncbi:hypothetical protein Pcinc_028083 [Petrolisthes cinctipes]|uniref:Uncharacterized protein n=1 Tax=Petrolisthes cinctipes TaxID=88211 RepID=A0AAE1F4E5_PETCI|nr:hypothetical protein Pcinc_028083 [Petrolisthes cinctipes]
MDYVRILIHLYLGNSCLILTGGSICLLWDAPTHHEAQPMGGKVDPDSTQSADEERNYGGGGGAAVVAVFNQASWVSGWVPMLGCHGMSEWIDWPRQMYLIVPFLSKISLLLTCSPSSIFMSEGVARNDGEAVRSS